MKILHIIPTLEIGGAQKMLSELVKEQKKLGYDVDVLVYHIVKSKFEINLVNNGVRIINLNRNSLKGIGIIAAIRLHLQEYDIIHTHLFPALYQVPLSNIGLNKPLVYTEHNTHNRRRSIKILRPIEQFLYSKYEKIIAISPRTKYNLAEWLHLKGKTMERIVTISNGIDLEPLKSGIGKSVNINAKYILMVSRFSEAKDQETLIKSIQYIKDNNIKIVFAGDGATLELNKQIAKKIGVEHRCIFLGNRNDVPDLIKQSIIGVQSSHWEGFGLTAVEFMAAGKPIVASSVDGLMQVVEGAGLLFKCGDEKELANNINKLLMDEKYYCDISQRCRIRAETYDIKSMTKAYCKLYNEIFLK